MTAFCLTKSGALLYNVGKPEKNMLDASNVQLSILATRAKLSKQPLAKSGEHTGAVMRLHESLIVFVCS